MLPQTGQTITDRLNAVRFGLVGQGLAKSVCKATTEEPIGPKKKHLDYLLHCTEEPNVSVPTLANLLIERTQHTSWVVVYKSLTTVHHLMLYGNERFIQYFASANINLTDLNPTYMTRGSPNYTEYSVYIRHYANYLNQKALSYRAVAFDFCRAKRGKDDGILRKLNSDQLLKTLPIVQRQIDSLLEFELTPADCSNAVISGCFMLLFRDLIRVFATYNDGIINLLVKYFEMQKKQCKDALEIYKRFLTRMDRVTDFLKLAESVGVPRGEIPDLTKAPASLLDALEQHLEMMEGRKPTSPSSTVNPSTSLHAGLHNLTATEASFDDVSETEKLRVLREEEEAMRRMKEAHQAKATDGSPQHAAGSADSLNGAAGNAAATGAGSPQGAAAALTPPEKQSPDFDPFGMFGSAPPPASQSSPAKTSGAMNDIDFLLGDLTYTPAAPEQQFPGGAAMAASSSQVLAATPAAGTGWDSMTGAPLSAGQSATQQPQAAPPAAAAPPVNMLQGGLDQSLQNFMQNLKL